VVNVLKLKQATGYIELILRHIHF